MKMHLNESGIKVVHGDSLDVLKRLPDDSIHAFVTDPPYGLSNTDPKHVIEALSKWSSGERDFVPTVKGGGFMGQAWDSFVPPPALWDEVFRVLKPGGHLLCFAGARTFDLMGMALRIAGFDIRDTIEWVYGSGFPKSMNVGKAIDKALGAEREVIGVAKGAGSSNTESLGVYRKEYNATAPATAEARQWEGWGTALKPAHEPILVAQKPFKGTVANNVLTRGTGALNIDACRVGTGEESQGDRSPEEPSSETRYTEEGGTNFAATPGPRGGSPAGRWPANLILQHTEDCTLTGTKKVKAITGTNSGRGAGTKAEDSDVYGTYAGRTDMDKGAPVGLGDADGMEVVEAWECAPGCPIPEMDAQSGERKSGGKVMGTEPSNTGESGIYSKWGRVENKPFTDKGGASRFFYQAKAAKKERPSYTDADGKVVVHPTVKPLDLMRLLTRMVTPPGGTVVDPFAGSGTTGEAALLEDLNCILIEGEEKFIPLIVNRIQRNQKD